MQTTSTKPATMQRAALLARLTLAGIALYVALDVVAQLLPLHYSPISQAESELGVGQYGWVMSINFIVRGLLSLSLVLALRAGLAAAARSQVGELLLALWAIAAFVLAFAPTDLAGQPATLHGQIHLLAAFIAFVASAIGELVISLRLQADPRLRGVAPVALVIAVAAIVMVLVNLVTIRGHIVGLTERIFLGLILLWMAVVAARLSSPRPAA